MDDVTSRRLRIVGGVVASGAAVGAVGALAWRNRGLIGELMGDGGDATPTHDAASGSPVPEATAVPVHAGREGEVAAEVAAPSPQPAPGHDDGWERPKARRPFARRTDEGRVFTSLDPEGDLRHTCGEMTQAASRLKAGEITAGEMSILMKRVVDQCYALISESPPTGGGRFWTHTARGKTYEEVGRATLQVVTVPPVESDVLIVHRDGMGLTARRPEDVPSDTTGTYVVRASLQVSSRPLVHGDVLVIYRDADGACFARERAEFLDGRFVPAGEGAPSA